MSYLQKLVYLSEAQKNTLFSTGSVTVDGVTITYNQNDLYVTPTDISPSNTTPQPLGTAGAGSSAAYSRADHIHAMPSAADVGAVAASSFASLPIKSIMDIAMTAGNYTWTQSGSLYKTTVRSDSAGVFNRTGLKNVQIVAYGGTPIFAIMDGTNVVFLAAAEPGASETFKVRGFFDS